MPFDSETPPWPPIEPQPPATPLAEPTENPSKKRPAWLGWVVGLAVVVVAVGAFFVAKSISGSGSSAAASTGNSATSNANTSENGRFSGRFPGAAGKITSIDGTTLTVQDQQANKSVKVTTNGSTRVTIEKNVTVADIANGDRISVSGTQSGTTIAATRITVTDLQAGGPQGAGQQGGAAPGNGSQGGFTPPEGFGGTNGGPPATDSNGNPTRVRGNGNGQPPGGFAFGTVTNVDGNTITISSFNGSTMTVTTTSATTVTKSVQGSFSDLKVGQTIRATGTTGSDGTIAATSINEGSGGFGAFRGRAAQGTP